MLKRSLPILAVLSLWHRYLWAKQSQSWSESEVQVLACLAYHIGTLAVHSLGQGQCGDEYPSKQVSKAASTPLHGIISMHCEHLQAMFVLEASQCNADLTSAYIYIAYFQATCKCMTFTLLLRQSGVAWDPVRAYLEGWFWFLVYCMYCFVLHFR